MNKQHLKNNRTATLPNPQGNDSAKLLDKDGNPKQVAEPKFEMLDLSLFRLDIPSENDDDSTGRSDSAEEMTGGLSYGRVALMEARQNADGKLSDFIEYCESAYKGLKKAAEALIEPHLPVYLEWVKQYRPTQNVELKHKQRGNKLTLTPEDYDDSVETILWLMAKISNAKLFGKPATRSKKATPSIFYNPKAVSKLAGFEGNSEKVRAMAEVNFLIVDNTGDIEYFFTQLGDLARYILHSNQAEATEIWRKLTGKIVADQRVVFPEKVIQDLGQARMYGSLAALFADEARKAADEKYKLALSDAEEARLNEYRRTQKAALNKAEDDRNSTDRKVDKIADSKIPAPDGRASLPPATQTPLTLEDIENRKLVKQAGRQAEAEMNAAINDGRLKADDLDACQLFWEEANVRALAARGIIEAATESDDDDSESPELNNDSEAAEIESTETTA